MGYTELFVVFVPVILILLQCDGCASFTVSSRRLGSRRTDRIGSLAFERTTAFMPIDIDALNVRRFMTPQADEVADEDVEYDMKDLSQRTDRVNQKRAMDRRDMLQASGMAWTALAVSTKASAALLDPSSTSFTPAIRPTSYRVDSTIPPTLLPVATARAQLAVLRDLGQGLGTDKKAVFIDTLNLNNMLQKAVYGTADVLGNLGKGKSNTQAPASFVCFGLPTQLSAQDVDLTVSLLQSMWGSGKQSKRAIGLVAVPYTLQGTLNDFVEGRVPLTTVKDALLEQQIMSFEAWSMYAPLFEFAARNQIALLALGLAPADRATVLQNGLQAVNPDARALYVVDPQGFIATTTDPAFKLYTDRSLLKDNDTKSTTGNFFAERILVHEAAATRAATYAAERGPGTVVAIVTPMADVRYLGGINGRLPRVYQRLNANAPDVAVTANDVTTILLNPTAPDTLSRTVRLRLEIGTGPETLAYQTKIADYLWFSSSPAVSLLPRVMDY